LRMLAFGETPWIVDRPETFTFLFKGFPCLERFHMYYLPPPDTLQEIYEVCSKAEVL